MEDIALFDSNCGFLVLDFRQFRGTLRWGEVVLAGLSLFFL